MVKFKRKKFEREVNKMEKVTSISKTSEEIKQKSQSEFESLLERINEEFSTLYNLILNSASVHNADPKIDSLAHYILYKYQSSPLQVDSSHISLEKTLWAQIDYYIDLTPYNDKLNTMRNSDVYNDFDEALNTAQENVKDDFSLVLDNSIKFLNKLMNGKFKFIIKNCSLKNFDFNETLGLKAFAKFTITIK